MRYVHHNRFSAFRFTVALLAGLGAIGCGRAAPPVVVPQPAPAEVKKSEHPAQPPAWDVAIERLWSQGDIDGIIATCDRVLADEPRNTAALVWRAYAHLQAVRMEQCQADLNAALAIDPNCADAWAAKGDAELATSSDHPAARKLYDRALEIDPRCELALRARARSFAFQEEYDKAIADYTKLVEMSGAPLDYFELGQAHHQFDDDDAALRDFDAAIQLQSNYANYFAQRGYVYDSLNKVDEAKADFGKAIELDPENPAHYWARASLNIRAGDLDAGNADWLVAIALTPNHVGKHYHFRQFRNAALSDDDLRHGEEQLRAIVRDRPEMAEFARPGDRLWTWAVRKLAGDEVGEPVYWNPRPLRHAPAVHRIPTDDHAGFIQIADDPEIRGDREDTAFEQCWACLVFELHNMTFADEFAAVDKVVSSDKLERHNYVIAMSEIEDRAGQLQAAFYADVFLPWSKEAGFTKSNPELWRDRFPAIDTMPPEGDVDADYYGYYIDSYELQLSVEEVQAGKHAEAKARLEVIVSRPTALEDESLSNVYWCLGQAQLALGDQTQSLESFKQAVALDDVWLGEHAYPMKGRTFISKSVESETTRDAGAHFLRGCVWGNLGDFDKSLEDLDKALEIDPQFVVARFQRATVYHHQNDLDRCLAELDQVLQINPDFHYARVTRGTIWMEKKDLTKALADLDEDVRRRPDSPEALLFRAQAYNMNVDVDKALADLNEAIRLDENFDSVWLLRGMVQSVRGDIAGAMKDFEHALTLSPDAGAVYYARALVQVRLRNFSQALADLEHHLGDAVEEPWGLAFKGKALVGLGDYDAAASAAEAAIKLDPSVQLGYEVRGDVHRARAEYAAALTEYDRAVEVLPDAHQSYLARATLLSECEDAMVRNIERAVQDATRACELTDWKDHECLSSLAACHAEAGDFAKAVEWETKALEIARGDWKKQHERNLETFRLNKTLRQAERERQTTESPTP